jgi:glycosyltransferase involved in cell wall biosynthesis
MRFSLIMATMGRVSEVERFLRSLDSQTHREFELIVADQNRDGRLLPILAAYRERFSILHLKSKPGLSRARNVGLPYVTGEVVTFPDDDCWYSPKLLELIAKFFCDRPELDGITGRMRDERGHPGIGKWFDREPGLLGQINAWKRVASITLFLRRSVIAAVGEFDEALGVGSGTSWEGGEDIDYALRAVEAGLKIYYEPDILIYHPNPPEYEERDYSKLADRAYKYAMGSGRVWKKHDYPLWFVAYYLLRPVGGAILSLMQGRGGKAHYHFSAFRGRFRGWFHSQ